MFISGNSAIWSNDDMMFLYRSFMLVMFVLLWWLLKIKLNFGFGRWFSFSDFQSPCLFSVEYICGHALPTVSVAVDCSFWDGLIFRGYVNFSGVYSFSLGRHFLHLRTSTTTPWSFFLRWIFLGHNEITYKPSLCHCLFFFWKMPSWDVMRFGCKKCRDATLEVSAEAPGHQWWKIITSPETSRKYGFI